MNIIWSPEALQDLADVRDYISQSNPSAAKGVVARILSLVSEQLPANPKSGRPGRVAGTRELFVSRTPFVIPYRIRGDRVEILRVYHASRLWPDRF